MIDGLIHLSRVITTEVISGAEELMTTNLFSLVNVSILVASGPSKFIDMAFVGEAITHLLENGFTPRRTIILSHGNDEEEVFARRGQGHIAPFLEERYGKDGLLMVIDEGSGTADDVSCSWEKLMKEQGITSLVLWIGLCFACDG